MIRPINNEGGAVASTFVDLPDQIKKCKVFRNMTIILIDADLADGTDESWASAYTVDFRKRLLNLLGFEFRHLPCSLAL